MFVAMPTAQAGAGPANVEYGYEPISGIGNGSSSDDKGVIGAPDDGSAAFSSVESADSGPGFLGIITGSWVLIFALVLVGAFLIWQVRRQYSDQGASAGIFTRLVALAAVLVALPLIAFSSAQSATRAVAPKGFFGVINQTDFTATDSTRMARGGIESLRVPLSWASVQPSNSEDFNWIATDNVIGLAAKSGMSTLPFIYSSPDWVTGSITRLPVNGSDERQAWTKFVGAAVERYGKGGEFWQEHGPDSADPITPRPVKTWQIWNEANFFYFADPVSPKNYLTVLKLADKKIEEVDPSARIMLSGLYGSPPKKQIRRKNAMNSYAFLSELYARGARNYFDVAAIHPYTPNTKTTEALINRFRKVMAENRDGNKALSITEVGWGSNRNGFLDVGSKQAQAKQVKSAYNYFLGSRRKLKLESVYWFAWKDKKPSEESCNFCYSTGWFTAANGLNAKPSWKQFVKFSGGRP